MGSGHVAAYSAVSISIVSVCCCVLFVPMLLAKISEIQGQLRMEMEEFTIASGDVWREIQSARRAKPTVVRAKRQAGQCQCESQNACPPGPVGLPGETGLDGEPGKAGQDGEPGLPGINPPVNTTPDGRCRICPGGARGPPGPPGNAGQPGGKGDSGRAGQPGNDGRPGAPGQPGIGGDSGTPGNNGESGEPGRPGTRGSKGEAGEPGRDGAPGEKGPSGQPGRNGIAGRPGSPGPVGPAGPPGGSGQPGQDGFEGGLGAPGEDAQYCPCPRRSGLAAFKAVAQQSLVEEVASSNVKGGSEVFDSDSQDVDYAQVPEEGRIRIGEKAKIAEKIEVSTEEATESPSNAWYKPVISYVTRVLSPDEVALKRRTTVAPPRELKPALKLSKETEPSLEASAESSGESAEATTAKLIVFPAEEQVEDALNETPLKEDNSDEFDAAREQILRSYPATFDGNQKDVIFQAKKN